MKNLDESRVLDKLHKFNLDDFSVFTYSEYAEKFKQNKQYFDGAGMFSAANSFMLHVILNRGFSISSGMSQGGEKPGDREELMNITRNIAMALTGRTIEFGEEIDYAKAESNRCPHPLEILEYHRQKTEKKW